MNKLLVICGPTATGKTKLAIELAKKFNGELVSGDSRQVYIGMDIGTGKDHPPGVKIHLIDVVEPSFRFTVADYVAGARPVIEQIWSKGKLPIIVGGTGFYIKALIDGIATIGIPPNLRLREKLEKKSTGELLEELQALDPLRVARMNFSDQSNPRRLIRAIEVARWQLENPSWSSPSVVSPKDCLWLGLKAPLKILYQRIDRRIKQRLKQGLEKEIKKLIASGYNWQNSALGETLGYQEWQPFFEGKKTKEEVIQRWCFNEHAYARQQMTWFRKALRHAQGHWFEITQPGFDKQVKKLVQKWIEQEHARKN